MPDVVRLALGGREYEGWTGLRIVRSIEAGAGAFELQLSERYPTDPATRPIRPGSVCEIKIDDQVLITGHVDEVQVSLDASQHMISVRGRDAVGDLVDCAPDIEPATWSNLSLLELCTKLARPFGIPVRAAAPVGPLFETVALNAGETAWGLIEQLCRYRQLLPISDGAGGLLLTRAGTTRLASAIVEGQNLLRCNATYSEVDRHSVYYVKGQSFETGDDGDAETGRASSGPIRDRDVKRHRPLLIVAGQAVDNQRCIDRARWEALTRAARAVRATADVVGWRDSLGALWPLNVRVPVLAPSLGLGGEFLICEVTFNLDSGGRSTSMVLARPDAYTVSPDREPEPQEEVQ